MKHMWMSLVKVVQSGGVSVPSSMSYRQRIGTTLAHFLFIPEESLFEPEPFKSMILCKIHGKFGARPGYVGQECVCRWHNISLGECETAGHIVVHHTRPMILRFLLDSGLESLLGV